MEVSYLDARDNFLSEMVRVAHTIRNYARGINLFIGDLSDKDDGPRFSPTPLDHLDAGDKAILVRYTQWLLDARGLAPATVRLYLVAVRKWFEWMSVNDYLPVAFPLAKAQWSLKDALAGSIFRVDRRPPEPPEGIEQAITYYDNLTMPTKLQANPIPERVQRWSLTTFRNRALMHALAETGGRVSEVLQLRADDFPEQAFEGDVWRVRIRGKGGHRYHLRFLAALPHIETYIGARGREGNALLFIYHSKRYDNQPMSRRAAWGVVFEAADQSGLGRIHPHDFRHWVASQLVAAGEPLDVIQDFLGHRSVETTRGYYAHTREARVDEATRRLSE